MLLFELFPLFVAVLSVLVGIGLFVADRRSRSDPAPDVRRPARPGSPSAAPERPGRRPSMEP